MIWIVLGILGLLVLAVGAVVAGVVWTVFAPHREALPEKQLWGLGVLGLVAFVAMLTLVATADGAWFVVPVVLWFAAMIVMRHAAPLRETDQQRRVREASEKKREAARAAVRERKRADAFGRDGLRLMDRAKVAVDNVMATEAARKGWLGQPGDLDFSADLAMIAETLRQARRIEKLVAESKAIPKPTDDDTRMLREAQRAAKQLRGDVSRRVQLLNDCAGQARQVDRTLAEEREQARLAAVRDEVRSRLSGELYGVEAMPPDPISDAADAVGAHVAAFLELKGVIDEQLWVEIATATEAAADDPPLASENALTWIRRRLPF